METWKRTTCNRDLHFSYTSDHHVLSVQESVYVLSFGHLEVTMLGDLMLSLPRYSQPLHLPQIFSTIVALATRSISAVFLQRANFTDLDTGQAENLGTESVQYVSVILLCKCLHLTDLQSICTLNVIVAYTFWEFTSPSSQPFVIKSVWVYSARSECHKGKAAEP